MDKPPHRDKVSSIEGGTAGLFDVTLFDVALLNVALFNAAQFDVALF